MSNKKEFTINNYSAMNKFAEDEVAYANQASRIHNARAFGIYAKYISLILLAAGLLLLFIGVFYWLYAVKPSQLAYIENNYSTNPAEIKKMMESQTDEILSYVDNRNFMTEQKIIELGQEVDLLNNSMQSDIKLLNNKIDRKNLQIQDSIKSAMSEQAFDFNNTIQVKNNELEEKLKSFISSDYLPKNGDQSYGNQTMIAEEYKIQSGQTDTHNTYFKKHSLDAVKNNDAGTLSIKDSLNRITDYFLEKKKINTTYDQPKTYMKYSDIKDTDCDRIKNPFCSFHSSASSKNSHTAETNGSNSQEYTKLDFDGQEFVVFQENEIVVNNVPYKIVNQWGYKGQNFDYPNYQVCYTYINIPNSRINSFKLDLYKKDLQNPPILMSASADFRELSPNTIDSLLQNCFFADQENQSVVNRNLDLTYYAVFDSPHSIYLGNTAYNVRTGYSFLDRALNMPFVEYCYTMFNTRQKTGSNKIVTVYLKHKENNIIKDSIGPNHNLLSQYEKENLTNYCNINNQI